MQESRIISADAYARRIVRAAERGAREVVMTARGRVGQWLRLVAPALTDRIARRAIERGV